MYVLRRTDTFSMDGSVLGGEFVRSHTLKESSSCRRLCPRSLSPVVVERGNGIRKLFVVATSMDNWVMQTNYRKHLMLPNYRNSLHGVPKDGSKGMIITFSLLLWVDEL